MGSALTIAGFVVLSYVYSSRNETWIVPLIGFVAGNQEQCA